MEEPGRKGAGRSRQKGKQEGIGESSNEEKFVTGLPVEETRALEGQLAFVEADGHFNLPATGIGEDNLPSELGRVSGFGGEQIPRGLSFASGND